MKQLSRLFPIILANILPILGVLFWGWDSYFIMYLYVVELWIVLMFFFIAFMVKFKKKCKKFGEFMLIFVIMLFVVASICMVFMAMPLDYLNEHAPKDSIIYSEACDGFKCKGPIDRFFDSINPYTIVPILLFILGHAISFAMDYKEDKNLGKFASKWAVGLGMILLVMLFTQLLVVKMGLPVPMLALFILFRVIGESLLVEKVS